MGPGFIFSIHNIFNIKLQHPVAHKQKKQNAKYDEIFYLVVLLVMSGLTTALNVNKFAF
jgi:hypothetical protein